MFAVVVRIETRAGAMADFLPAMLENARASARDEPGCLRFDVLTDPSRPDAVMLYELYEDAAAFEAHKATAHYARFDAATRDMIAVKDVTTWAGVEG